MPRGGPLAALPEGEEVVKIAMIICWPVWATCFWRCAFYVVYCTGSTEGLAGIGNTTLLSVAAAALAGGAACAPSSPDIMRTLEAGSARDPPTPAGL